jgi:LPXTG-motif cell wall-anchored protein
MYGLTYGDYYLVETKAPDGYVILDKAVPVVVNSYTHIEGNYIKVINVRKSILPSTGDSGAILVYILILAFVLSAAVFILTNKKKRAV